MRKLLTLTVVVAVMGGGVGTNTAEAKPQNHRCVKIHEGINYYRNATHKWQTKMGEPITKSSKMRVVGCKYAAWVANVWRNRAAAWRVKFKNFTTWLTDPINAIRYVFGEHADEAISVARCESGGTFSVWASNGQFQGMFQMGSSERARFGHGYTPLEQARAAYRYFRVSGWSPWQCQPGGGLRW